MASASCQQDGDVIWFPRCLNTCVRNLQWLSLAGLRSSSPRRISSFWASLMCWCAMWLYGEACNRALLNTLRKSLIWSSWRLGKYLETQCVHSMSVYSSLGVCLVQLFEFLIPENRKGGGRREEGGGSTSLPPHPAPKFSIRKHTVMCDGKAADSLDPDVLAQAAVAGMGWHLHSDSKGGAKVAALQAVVPSPRWMQRTPVDRLKGDKDISECSFITSWRGNLVCLLMGKRNAVK